MAVNGVTSNTLATTAFSATTIFVQFEIVFLSLFCKFRFKKQKPLLPYCNSCCGFVKGPKGLHQKSVKLAGRKTLSKFATTIASSASFYSSKWISSLEQLITQLAQLLSNSATTSNHICGFIVLLLKLLFIVLNHIKRVAKKL